jgi:hypothetical protein
LSFKLKASTKVQKVQEGPELVQVVLEGRPGQKELVLAVNVSRCLGDERVVPLDLVSLVQYQVVEVLALEQASHVLGQQHLVAGDDHVVRQTIRLEQAALLLPNHLVGGVQAQKAKAWRPLFELGAPRRQYGERAHHQARSGHPFRLLQIAEERDGLQRLAL